MLKSTSPFRTVLYFAVLVVSGWIVIPLLKVDLLPQQKVSALNVTFLLPNSSPEIVENEVTSIIEEACSQLSQLKKITSVSKYNNGEVQLQFDKTADMQYKQFEVTSIIRQIYHKLPASCSYPMVLNGTNRERKGPMLTFSINAPLQPFFIKQQSEEIFLKAFAGIQGIKEAKVSSTENLQISIVFDKNKCQELSIKPMDIIKNIKSYFTPFWPGNYTKEDGEQFFIVISPNNASIETLENIIIPVTNNQSILLKDVAKVYIEEQEPADYFRINGKSSVSLNLYAREGENKIFLAKKAKELVNQVKSLLPSNFEVRLNYDETEYLEKEITKNYQRAGLSACILIIFILLAYRNWRHLLNLFLSLLTSISLTLLLAWLFNINIHLYTIAGLAISFGIITDNAIVMLDYFIQFKNRKIFMALLGASLTTIAALSLVFFLPEQEKNYLLDFSIIIVLALISSLITALWLIPSLFHILFHRQNNSTLNSYTSADFSRNRNDMLKPMKRWKQNLFSIYYAIISFLAKFRKTYIAIIVLSFGLPFFMLPASWEGNNWYNRLYNLSFGNNYFQKNIRSKTDKLLGGTLRLFANNVSENGGYRSQEKTKLYIQAELPYNTTPQQMNYLISDFEIFLSKIEGIDQYVTNIYSGQSGSIEISFKPGFVNSTLPYQLKSKLIARSLEWSGVEWNIYGLGRGFSNSGVGETPTFQVLMKGYNYNELEKQATVLSNKLLKHSRIHKVNTNELLDLNQKQGIEYVLSLNPMQISLLKSNKVEILDKISSISKATNPSAQIIINDQFYPVILKEKQSEKYSSYNLLHSHIELDSKWSFRISNLGKLELLTTSSAIHKEDRQYIRIVGFEYMGPEQFGSNYLEKVLKETKQELPIGYTAERKNWKWDSSLKYRKYFLILALSIAIFFICSILFENLKEPFFIIVMIPISFIGLFLIFSIGDFYFDQGGFAAFVLLGGLVSNAAIYIINDFNVLKIKKSTNLYNRILIKATLNRSRTIFLTTISTSCGLIPFLLEGQNEVFWFSLAIGTIGGLLFSLFAVFFALPVFLWKNN